MKYNALPTWLLVRAFWPLLRFKKDHPWRNRRPFTLQEWHDGRTDYTKAFDILLAGNALAAPFIIYLLFTI